MSRSAKYRDAGTGAYVTEEYAKANPGTTVKESDDRVGDLERRVQQLEGALTTLATLVHSKR